MDDDNIIAELRGVTQQMKALRDSAYTLYDAATKDILSDRITDAKRIITIMDGLCDFCDEDRFISLSHAFRLLVDAVLNEKTCQQPQGCSIITDGKRRR